jgi:hypothetical protein
MYRQRKRIPVGWYGKKTQGRKVSTLTSSFSASDWNTPALALSGNGTPCHKETVNDSFLRPEPVNAAPVESNFDEAAANVSDSALLDDKDGKDKFEKKIQARQASASQQFVPLQTGHWAARTTKEEPPTKKEAKKRKMSFLLPGSSDLEGDISE